MIKMKSIKLILLGLMILFFGSCQNKKMTDHRGKIKFDKIHIAPKITGRVKEIRVKEGQTIQKGDTLLVLEVPELQAKKMQAMGAFQAAKAQLQMAYNGATIEQVKQIDGKLEAAQSQLDFAKESYERIKNMYTDSLVPSQKYDEVRMKYRMAQAQVNAIKAKKKEVLKGTRKEVIAQAKGQLKRALGALEEIKTAENERYIVAPQDFRIDHISLQKGELATAGYTLINGTLYNSAYFRFSIPEHNIQHFKVDQIVELTNPFINEKLKAKVVEIKPLNHYADITAPATSYQLGETVYEMKLIPLDIHKTGNFKQNMTFLILN